MRVRMRMRVKMMMLVIFNALGVEGSRASVKSCARARHKEFRLRLLRPTQD